MSTIDASTHGPGRGSRVGHRSADRSTIAFTATCAPDRLLHSATTNRWRRYVTTAVTVAAAAVMTPGHGASRPNHPVNVNAAPADTQTITNATAYRSSRSATNVAASQQSA